MAATPQSQGWLCRNTSCDGQWFRLDGVLVCQCRRARCRRIIAIHADPVIRAAAIAALCSTDSRPATDWPGCTD